MKDKNGYICSRELASVLRAYGCNPTEREVFSLMAEVDVNHNGKIELREAFKVKKNKKKSTLGSSSKCENFHTF